VKSLKQGKMILIPTYKFIVDTWGITTEVLHPIFVCYVTSFCYVSGSWV